MARFRLKYPMLDVPAAWHLSGQDLAQVDFRLERLGPGNSVFVRAALAIVMWLALRLGRLRLFGVTIIARDADVTQVLGDPAQFPVPFGGDMRLLAHGPPGIDADPALRPVFMLGADGPEHASQRALVFAAMQHCAASQSRFVGDTSVIAAALIANCDGQIDIMRDVFARVSAQTGAEWLGLAVPDIDAYSDWTLAMSAMLFGDPAGNAVIRELAQHGGWRLRALIDGRIAQCAAQLAPLPPAARDEIAATRGLIWALVAARLDQNAVLSPADHALIRAIITGMVIGLGPTTTLAGGKAFAWLLRHPAAFALAQAAATAGDRDAMRRIVLEAARMAPALDPGQFRTGAGDTVVLAATAAALRDGRRWPSPGRFDPDRWIGQENAPNLLFGHGIHACISQHMAVDQLTSIFALL
ncbi:cytochrome P450, partial [Sandarakinorhabdus sp.]|uniref:cytochrome P450 n=1 Tax=Sandarakinorhabdus sp. TaxID=1916663 RepID=UPI0033406EF0